jgi:hypothetical protein
MSDEEYIIPRYRMIFSYDILPFNRDRYFQFVTTEMVPALQDMGIYMTEAWHTAYGEYPVRMVCFVAEDLDTIEAALESERWFELEGEFKEYVRNYTRKVVAYKQGFQFVPNMN